MALKTLPFGGMYLIGGVTTGIAKHLLKEDTFLKNFNMKGRLSSIVQQVPLYLVKEEKNVGLLGCEEYAERILMREQARLKGQWEKKVNYQRSLLLLITSIQLLITNNTQLINKNEIVAVVIIDEIGLAEISIHNPLKVLHSLLEPPKVPAIGISNWPLDAAKMNRGITLSRPDPGDEDLEESALSIATEIFTFRKRKNLIIDFRNNYLK